ncbi:MAG TPA: DUF1289 domain-containing protein [Porticoccaceae bacterium]|nr:DUF1289 domain-containing protein [Porticoccaceae bacterium]
MSAEDREISPCVAICHLNEDDMCTGCYRMSSEITDWRFLPMEKKRQVLSLCDERRELLA